MIMHVKKFIKGNQCTGGDVYYSPDFTDDCMVIAYFIYTHIYGRIQLVRALLC